MSFSRIDLSMWGGVCVTHYSYAFDFIQKYENYLLNINSGLLLVVYTLF